MQSQWLVRPGILVVASILGAAAVAQEPPASCAGELCSLKAAPFTGTLKSPDGKKVLAMKRQPPADDDESSICYTVAVDGRHFSTQRLTDAYVGKTVRFNGANGFGPMTQSLEGKSGEASFSPLVITKRPVYEPTMVRACDVLGFGCNYGYSGIGPVRLRFPFDSPSARGH